MSGFRPGRSLVALAVGLIGLGALTPIAAARPSESASVTLAPQEQGSVTARCGAGSEAVSGGFAAPGFNPIADDRSAILTFASQRPAAGKWGSEGFNSHFSSSGRLIAQAYCDRNAPHVTTSSRSTVVPANGHASVVAECARGSEVVSGGFRSDRPDESGLTAYPYTSKRLGDRDWKIAAWNQTDVDHTMTAFAYCERHGPKLVTRTSSAALFQGASNTLSAYCRKGSGAFSGGYKTTFNGQFGFPDGFAWTSKRGAGPKWKVSAFGVIGPSRQTPHPKETVFAYCAS
jgi:hypothetical protein